MSSLSDLRPGDLMFGPIGGLVPGVFPVGVGEILLAGNKDRLSWRTWWKIRHVGVVVQAAQPITALDAPFGSLLSFGGQIYTRPRMVQAMPSGAEEVPLGIGYWTEGFVYVRPPYRTLGVSFPGTAQADDVATFARRYVGTPYSFLDYAAILGAKLGIKHGPIRKYVTTSKHMICSQLADQAMSDAGYHVFDDGRLPQDVTPADLYRAMLTTPGALFMRPGDSVTRSPA